MTYEEYKAAVIAEFPQDMSLRHLMDWHTAQDHVLLMGEPPLEERLEIYRRSLKRAYQALIDRGREVDLMLWTSQAVKSLHQTGEKAPSANPPAGDAPAPRAEIG